MVTVPLCVVYITLNCNSLNKRPNCFLYAYVQTFILTPRPASPALVSYVSLRSKAHTAAARRRLGLTLGTARGPRSEGQDVHEGFGPLGHPAAPRLVSDSSSGPAGSQPPAGMRLRESWSLSGGPGWWLESGHTVVGSLHPQHHRPHIPGRLERGRHSSVHHGLDPGGWRRPRPGTPPAPCGEQEPRLRTTHRQGGPGLGPYIPTGQQSGESPERGSLSRAWLAPQTHGHRSGTRGAPGAPRAV